MRKPLPFFKGLGKTVMFIVLLATASAVAGQQVYGGAITKNALSAQMQNNLSRNASGHSGRPEAASSCDTLFNLSSTENLYILTLGAGDTGYAAGNNIYGATQVGEIFPSTVGDKVNGAIIAFGRVAINAADSAKTVTVKVWNNTGTGLTGNTGAPGVALDSTTVTLKTISQAITAGASVIFSFPHTPVLSTDSFFVTITLPTTAGDTVVLVTNFEGTDGNGWIDYPAFGGWATYDVIYGSPGSTGNYIKAIICSSATTSAPLVTTNAASAVSSSGANLNGSVNAEGASSTTGFQWGTTTSYTGGTVAATPSPVTGSVATAITYPLTGLAASTTYHYRAFAVNSGGTTYGGDVTFTTLGSSAPSGCDTLFNEKSVFDTIAYYPIDTPIGGFISGNNGYGDIAKAEGFASVIGDVVSGAELDFAYITYFDADTNLPVKILVWDNTGTSGIGYAGAPGNALDSTTVTLAQIRNSIIANTYLSVNFSGNVHLTTDTFYVGVVLPTTGDTIALFTNTVNGADGNGWELNAGTPPTWMSYNNDWGAPGKFGNYIKAIICGSQTAQAPSVITTGASGIASTSATLNGSVNAEGASSTTGFQWGLTTSYTGGTVTGTPSPVTGSTYTPVSYALSGLTAATTYHYRAFATNATGTTYGRDTTFITLSAGNVCTPAAGAPQGVTPAAMQVPCVTQGVSYSQTFTLVVPSTVFFQGSVLTVNSITVDSIGNLPSGLIWTPGVNPETISGGSSGCYVISGISNAACGQYLTPVYVTANTNLGFPVNITLNSAGVPNEFLQVISSGHSCPVPDTSQTVAFVADPSCGVTAAPAVTITPTGVACYGAQTGSAVANATGGNGTFTYSWSNGATTSSINNVIAGTYSVTVTSNGQTATASAVVTQPASALNVTASATQTSCSSNTGTASAVVTGGTSSYNYHWSNGSTLANLSGLAANTYRVTVTDANGCSATASTIVTVPAAFSVTVSATNVNCFGQSTGSVTALTNGSSGTLTYLWSNGNTTQSISNATAGTYLVTVTETSGCSSTGSGVITQPVSALSASASSTVTSCASNTGSATVTAIGGTASYTYSWSNGGTATVISSIGVGIYNVTVTDAQSCTATASASVNTSATYTVNVTSTNVGCNGASTGTATATLTGANGNIIYDWSTSATTQSVTALAAGTYSVTVKDASGCSKTASATVTQPLALSVSVATTQSACSSNTGTATATVAGGTSPYNYVWSNASHANPASGFGAGNITLTVTDANACSITSSGSVSTPAPPQVNAVASPVSCYGQSTGSVSVTVTGSSNDTYFWSNGATSSGISNVPANQYSVTVTDGFGCSASATASVTQPVSGITATTSSTPQSSCLTDNGSATVSAANGASPYSYLWSNSQGGTTISNLAAGNYTVTVTDNNHCTASATASVNSPATFTVAVTTTNDLCYGASTGSATVTVNGTGNYTYLWSNSITTATNTNLAAGTYGVTVTDGNGCVKAASGVVTQPATALVANATATNSTCGTASGTASVAVVGGTGSPSYLWNNNAVTSSITNLGVGVYSVTVTEGTCTATASAIVNNLNGPTVTMLFSNPTCSNSNNGSATAVPAGGTSPYTYTWSNNQTTSGLTGIGAGTYNVVVADQTGCQVVGSVTLTAPLALALNPAVVNVTCEGGNNGSVTLAVSGGTSAYSYSWSNSSSGPSVSGLSAAGISVTVTDSKQCTASGTFTITQPTAIIVSTTTTDATNGANGTATATASGGTGPYTYAWANSVTATDSNLIAGTYTVTVKDANQCSATASAVVIATGIDEVANNLTNIMLIPNPASDVVKIMVSVSSVQTVEFRMVDITGKYIYTSHETTVQGNVTHTINLDQFASGIYLVEIAAGNEVTRRKLVITR